ncbi:hypothetical protein GCM10023257_12560 [Streptomyces hyderabadensis]|uniref:Uncharacterized protein n=1 Tax=Streptomyces hyderabadensis TaxID=598549 RepID=A0ABP9HRF1_9ACTN
MGRQCPFRLQSDPALRNPCRRTTGFGCACTENRIPAEDFGQDVVAHPGEQRGAHDALSGHRVVAFLGCPQFVEGQERRSLVQGPQRGDGLADGVARVLPVREEVGRRRAGSGCRGVGRPRS